MIIKKILFVNFWLLWYNYVLVDKYSNYALVKKYSNLNEIYILLSGFNTDKSLNGEDSSSWGRKRFQ